MKAETFALAMLAISPAAAAERFDCFGHDAGGAPLRIYLEVGSRTVWSGVEDAQASGTDLITARNKTSIKFGRSTLARSGHSLTLADPTFGAFECSPHVDPFAR